MRMQRRWIRKRQGAIGSGKRCGYGQSQKGCSAKGGAAEGRRRANAEGLRILPAGANRKGGEPG